MQHKFLLIIFDTIIISEKRDYDNQVWNDKRLIQLTALKVEELNRLLEIYGIIKWNINNRKDSTKENLINAILLYETMSLGGKQTQIMISIDDTYKTYYVQTICNFILVTKRHIGYEEIYTIKNNLSSLNANSEIIYDKGRFHMKSLNSENVINIYNDIKACRKAILFIESYHFYLKVLYLKYVFNEYEINDIIRNICFVYFERTLVGTLNIKCKLE